MQRVGYNTDWLGFSEGLSRTLPEGPLGRVVQLGAGGAGSAVAYALLKRGAEHLLIFDNDLSRAQDLVGRMAGLFAPERILVGVDRDEAMARANGLVNCTPVGMAKYPGTPLPVALLDGRLWVADVAYFPLETELLKAARALGCRIIGGGGMAVFQAVEAFRLITGREPNAERMLANFRKLVADQP